MEMLDAYRVVIQALVGTITSIVTPILSVPFVLVFFTLIILTLCFAHFAGQLIWGSDAVSGCVHKSRGDSSRD